MTLLSWSKWNQSHYVIVGLCTYVRTYIHTFIHSFKMASLSRGQCYDSSIASVSSAVCHVPLSLLLRKAVHFLLTSFSSSCRPFHLSFNNVFLEGTMWPAQSAFLRFEACKMFKIMYWTGSTLDVYFLNTIGYWPWRFTARLFRCRKHSLTQFSFSGETSPLCLISNINI